jgi:hypothetical protein
VSKAAKAAKRIAPEAIRFQFVGHGAHDEPVGRTDRLCLDVGNALGPGVIDQHHLSAYTGSTTGLVLRHPDLVDASVNPRRRAGDPFTLVLHQDPDLDCAAAAFLAGHRLSTGEFPSGAEPLARYLDLVDQGHVGASEERPFSLYTAYLLLGHRGGLRNWRSREDFWRAWLGEGIELIRWAVAEAHQQELPLPELDAFACPGLFGPADRDDVRRDLERYRAKLTLPATGARSLRLRLPRQLGGMAEVDALLVRDVQQPDDPARVLFFKDWARSDRQFAPGRRGFTALSVFSTETAERPRRCIVSVRPDVNVSLRGLGDLLDQAEARERIRRLGVDDRVADPRTRFPKPARPGYANADPWYDGRAHGHTIVDAPRSGTQLSAEQIEAVLLEFGAAGAAPLELPAEHPASAKESRDTLGELSFLVNTWQRERPAAPPAAPAPVFISYPRARLPWVKANVYEPLRAWYPEADIFFDLDALEGGVVWFARLAEAIERCRLFLAVYCPEYFMSDFCQWELQLALVRDPIGRKGIVAPILLESVELPSYCKLIQAADATTERPERWLKALAGRAMG